MGKLLLGAVAAYMTLSIPAQKDMEYSAGYLIQIAAGVISLQPSGKNHESNYLFKLRTGLTDTITLYRTPPGKDPTQSFHESSEVAYRFSGKNVFLRTPNGHEIKTLLCEAKGDAIICGDDIFPKMK
jgi:hypothetical protein